MKVKELINILNEMNPEATLMMMTDGYVLPDWVVNFGGSEGVTKQTAESVSIHINPTKSEEPELNPFKKNHLINDMLHVIKSEIKKEDLSFILNEYGIENNLKD
ncbi:MAG: hypothetical protein AAF617_18250, partial [Bacteroidota bacterium]